MALSILRARRLILGIKMKIMAETIGMSPTSLHRLENGTFPLANVPHEWRERIEQMHNGCKLEYLVEFLHL